MFYTIDKLKNSIQCVNNIFKCKYSVKIIHPLLLIILFFVESGERKKATRKRYTARFPDHTLIWLLYCCELCSSNAILGRRT